MTTARAGEASKAALSASVRECHPRLEHEFADILGCVIVITERCGIGRASSFAATMDEIETALAAQP
jgi:hypothetical protein